jgi:DNA-binding MurR/RpiR family transcriptional regulator
MPETKQSEMNIVQTIQERYANLNNTNRKIANFILQNLEKATFLSLMEISKEIGVSDASLIRFAKKMGFVGFQELRENLVEYIRHIIYPTSKKRLMKEEGHSLVTTVMNKDINYIRRTMENLSVKEFEASVQTISDARKVFCMGWGYSSFLAEFMSFGLSFLSFESIPIIRERRPLIQQVFNLKDGDVLVVFDLLLYSAEVQEAVEYIHRKNKNIKIITLTNDSTAKIVGCADYSFYFDLSGHEFQLISLTAPMCFVNMIFEQLVSIQGERTSLALKEFQRIVQVSPTHYSQFNPK